MNLGVSVRNLAALRSAFARIVSPLLPGVLLVILVSAQQPWWRVREFNQDEGFNLGKAALYHAGFDLYRDIWNDQPPVLTAALAALQEVFPADVGAARALILLSAVLLLACLFRLAQRFHGPFVAWTSTLLLVFSSLFQLLSVSVLIGLPALALATLALDLATARWPRAWIGYLAAGMVYALALHTKLFVLPMLPAFILGCWATCPRHRRAAAVGVFLATAALAYLAIVWALAIPVGESLLAPHVAPSLRAGYSASRNLDAFFGTFRRFPLLGITYVASLFWIPVRARSIENLIPFSWAVSGATVLMLHTPLWSHQFLLVIVPGSSCPRIFIHATIRWAATATRPRRITAFVLLSAGVIAALANQGQTLSRSSRYEQALSSVERQILRYWKPGDWTFCDRALDCFRAGALVPPETVVNSGKRIAAGNLSSEAMLEMLNHRSPAQLLFREGIVPPLLRSALRKDYLAIDDLGPIEHFVRRDRLEALAPPVDRQAASRVVVTVATSLESAMGGTILGGFFDPGDKRRRERESAEAALGPTEIVSRPPHSAARAGACLLRAAEATEIPALREAGLRTARAFACSQLSDGGWARVGIVAPTCADGVASSAVESKPLRGSLDEGAPADIIDLLLDAAEVVDDEDRARFEASARRGLDFYVLAQARSGGWPQMYPPDPKKFERFFTLNDGVTTRAIEVLLRGWLHFGDERYRRAAEAGGDFLLRVQSPTGAWAQQYDGALRPAGARTFEPAAFSSLETGLAMLALADLFVETGEQRFLQPLGPARRWLLDRQIAPGVWARLYALDDGRPIYGDRNGRIRNDLRQISRERRIGYRWQGAFPEVERAIALAAATEHGDRERARKAREEIAARRLISNQMVGRYRLVEATEQSAGGAWRDEKGRLSTAAFTAYCEIIGAALGSREQIESAAQP